MEALQRLHNRGSISTGYDIDNSLKFEPDNSEYLTKSQSDGNKTTSTCSWWFKRSEINDSDYPAFISASSSSWQTRYALFNDGRLWIDLGYGTSYYRNLTNALLHDTAAWYHVVVALDSTQATASDRLKVYLNGELITSWNSQNLPAQNTEFKFFDSNHAMFVGTTTATDFRFAGYMADMHLVEGQQLAATDFGEFDEDSGIWKPKRYTGSHGSNGFYLDFSDSANLGDDASGNGNNFTETNITAANQATDTPTNNFATGNPILYFSTATTITEGATKIAKGANGWEILASTIPVTRGKWYAEVRNETIPESAMASIMPDDIELIFRGGQTINYPGKVVGDNGQGYYSYNGNYYRNGGNESYGASWTGSTNTIGIALDMDNGKLYFAKDNTWQNSGDPTSGSTGTGAIDVLAPTKPHLIGYTPYAANTDGFINFGGFTGAAISSAASDENGYGNFEFAPPSGYYALCTKNLEEYG